ncbi:CBS domain-containing protein [Streptomyces roseus]|uniref:CBS domain-containing protein n=1 Tax=Streptomyces roseus TaxID=66430 RepID=UPI0038094448
MKHIKVADLMTDEVVSVTPGTVFKDVVKLLAQYDITGVPVLDEEDRVVGVVSQTDLLARAAPGPDASQGDAGAGGASTAGEVMSSPAVTVRAEQTAADAARLMTRRGIERLPVVDVEDRLVGIITRRDLLRVFLRPDSEIRRRVRDEVLADVLAVPAGDIDVHVIDGVVALDGHIRQAEQLSLLISLVERIDGVVAVASHVTARSGAAASAGHSRDTAPW